MGTTISCSFSSVLSVVFSARDRSCYHYAQCHENQQDDELFHFYSLPLDVLPPDVLPWDVFDRARLDAVDATAQSIPFLLT